MFKLRILLQSKLFYGLLLLEILLYSVIVINIPKHSVYHGTEKEIVGIITSYRINGNKLTFVLNGKEKIIVSYYFKTKNEWMNFDFHLGDSIKVIGELNTPNSNTNFNLFDYKEYLYNNDIHYIMKATKIMLDSSNRNIFYSIKQKMIDRIDTSKEYEYLFVFLLGDDNYFGNDIQNNYKINGLLHLFSVSGMHVSLISVSLLFVLKKCNVEIKKKYFLVLLFLLFYAFLTGFGSSIVRSILFFSIIAINKIYYLKLNPISILILTFCILLFFHPFYLYDIGFQFSFVAVFYLLLVRKRIESFHNPVKKSLVTSLLCFLSTLPLVLYYNFEIHLLSPMINVFFIPYISYIVFPVSILSYLFPFLTSFLSILVSMMEYVSNSIATMQSWILTLGRPSFLFILFFYLIFTLFLIKYQYKYLFILIVVSVIYFHLRIFDSSFRITFIDVGQGDSILMEFPNRSHTVLIDSGGKVEYRREKWMETKNGNPSDYNVVPLLKSFGISKIDEFILTHGDIDHMGEAINLVNNFKVENVIFNCGEYNDFEKELINVLEKKNINYCSCIKELNIDKYKLQFLNTGVYDNENDNSSVIYLNYNNYKFLIMGDAGVNREKDIIEKYNLTDIDFLKVGHHGSNTSSSKEFINSINPKYSLISVGKNNRYGHPKDSVLGTLSGSNIYRTDIDGSIEIKSNKNEYKIRTCPP